jgi:hypothetical protein
MGDIINSNDAMRMYCLVILCSYSPAIRAHDDEGKFVTADDLIKTDFSSTSNIKHSVTVTQLAGVQVSSSSNAGEHFGMTPEFTSAFQNIAEGYR